MLILDAVKATPQVLDTPAPSVFFIGFGASALEFEVRRIRIATCAPVDGDQRSARRNRACAARAGNRDVVRSGKASGRFAVIEGLPLRSLNIERAERRSLNPPAL